MALVQFSELAPHIGQLMLNDPANLNAMGEEMAGEFRQLVSGLKSRTGNLRVIVLTGSGRAFSAGGHLEMLEKKTLLSKDENRKRMLDFYGAFLSVLDLGIPVIAALNGAAVGAGLCLATACDIRIACREAKLGFTFVKLGLHPGMGATYFLPRVIGPAFARELLLTGRVISAEAGKEMGLVSCLVEKEQLASKVLEVATEIVSGGPQAVQSLLQSLRGEKSALQQALTREAEMQAESYASAEFKEGIRAAIEKRAPSF